MPNLPRIHLDNIHIPNSLRRAAIIINNNISINMNSYMQFALHSIIVLISILNSIFSGGIQFTRLVCFTIFIKSNEPLLTATAFRFNTKIHCNSCCVSRHDDGKNNYIKFLFISNEKETTKAVHNTAHVQVCLHVFFQKVQNLPFIASSILHANGKSQNKL